ncbi:hypothetical protein BC628DRAFT_171074 [Trametes gibbosa]|nr:hypothetical protein BC628DRAFT_171074 [Trametes gibbosa]
MLGAAVRRNTTRVLGILCVQLYVIPRVFAHGTILESWQVNVQPSRLRYPTTSPDCPSAEPALEARLMDNTHFRPAKQFPIQFIPRYDVDKGVPQSALPRAARRASWGL